jgi:anti-sigma regulatory factor (Ser/Thr protein kinase)
VVTLEDWAAPFDPRTRELPGEEELARPLEEREAGGLGILLAIRGVDRFDYRRVGDHNETVFEVRAGEGR